MRWRLAENLNGTYRLRTEFLFFFKNIGGEIRWWERATFEERCVDGTWYPTRWME